MFLRYFIVAASVLYFVFMPIIVLGNDNNDYFESIRWYKKEIRLSILPPSPEVGIKYSDLRRVASGAIFSWTKHINISVKISKPVFHPLMTREDGINAIILCNEKSKYVNADNRLRKYDSENFAVTTIFPAFSSFKNHRMKISEADIEINIFDNKDIILIGVSHPHSVERIVSAS